MQEFNGLYSQKREDVLRAIEKARDHGTLEWVRPLMEVFRDLEDEEIRTEIAGLLGALKISDAASVFSDALDDPEFSSIHADVISFLWSCGFQSEDDLISIVQCAIDGDYRCAMEALTWVEELEHVLDEQVLLDVLLMLRGHLEEIDGQDIRVPLYQDMLLKLQRHERGQ